MKGFVISTENKMQFKDFNEPLLLSIGTEICGYSETVHPKYLPEGFCMVVNDEGLLRGLPLNRFASLLYGTPEHGQPIVGNAVILREGFIENKKHTERINDTNLFITNLLKFCTLLYKLCASHHPRQRD